MEGDPPKKRATDRVMHSIACMRARPLLAVRRVAVLCVGVLGGVEGGSRPNEGQR